MTTATYMARSVIDAKLDEHMAAVAGELRRRAKHGLWDGRVTPEGRRYMRHCTLDDESTATRLIFTRDTGHHSSGWLKNPDYERCFHLSTSPRPGLIVTLGDRQLADPDRQTMARWVRAFYGEAERHVWAESPKSPEGRRLGVWHWRVFCDEHWQPITPRGEVYSLEFTEVGWRSASQVFAEGGWHVSATEDGRTIESTVDPT